MSGFEDCPQISYNTERLDELKTIVRAGEEVDPQELADYLCTQMEKMFHQALAGPWEEARENSVASQDGQVAIDEGQFALKATATRVAGMGEVPSSESILERV